MTDTELCIQNGWNKGVILETGTVPHVTRMAIIEVGAALVFGQDVKENSPIVPMNLQNAPWHAVGRQIEHVSRKK